MLILAATRLAGCWERVVDSIDLIQCVKLNLLIDWFQMWEYAEAIDTAILNQIHWNRHWCVTAAA